MLSQNFRPRKNTELPNSPANAVDEAPKRGSWRDDRRALCHFMSGPPAGSFGDHANYVTPLSYTYPVNLNRKKEIWKQKKSIKS